MKGTLILILALFVSFLGRASGADSKLYFDESVFQQHLDGMTEANAPQEDRFELPLWQDGLGQKRVAADTPVDIAVKAFVPKTGEPLSDPIEFVRAKAGCIVEFKDGNLSITLRRPNVFVDPRPGSSSATWRYGISADLKKSGEAYAVAKGVLARKDKACISLFGLKAKKDGQDWKPADKAEYTYKIEMRPDDWKSFGELDEQAAHKKSGDGMARFIWAPGTENKSVEFRWVIEGQYTQTEATEWTSIQNPCCSDPPPVPPRGNVPEKSSNPEPPKKPSVPDPAEGEGTPNVFSVYSAGAGITNVRSSPEVRSDNVVWKAPDGLRVRQTGNGVADSKGQIWVPILYIEGSKRYTGYIRDKLLTNPGSE